MSEIMNDLSNDDQNDTISNGVNIDGSTATGGPSSIVNGKNQSRRFTQLEDQRLQELVGQFGARRWRRIAQFMPGRTSRQCRDRYCNYLTPEFYNEKWTNEEDMILYTKYQEFGSQWAKIAPFFPGKNANNIKNRWNYSVSRMKPNQLIKQHRTNNNSSNSNNVNCNNSSNNATSLSNSSGNQFQQQIIENLHNINVIDSSIPNVQNVQQQQNMQQQQQQNVQQQQNMQSAPILFLPPDICSLRQSNIARKGIIDTNVYDVKPRRLAPLPPISFLLESVKSV